MSAFMIPRVGLRLATASATPSSLPLLARSSNTTLRLLSTSSPKASQNVNFPLLRYATVSKPFLSTTSTILRLLPPRTAQRFHQSTLAANHPTTAASREDADAAATSATTIRPSTTTASSSSTSTPLISRPVVAVHLYALAFLVYAIVVVGGLTRLTESGLSITEWNPGFKGMRLPMTTAEWEAEWDKYKATPEFVLLNSKMSLDDFKSIYMWEWGHRVLGRVIGVTFVLPAAFFLTKKWVGVGTRWKLVGIAAGIGFQGFLGWFMVKSGLTAPNKEPAGMAKTVTIPIKDDHPNSTANTDGGKIRFDASATVPTSSAQTSIAAADWTPRVSHFRLAAHMGTAFLVYLAMLHTGLSIQRDYNVAKQSGKVSGVSAKSLPVLQRLANTLSHPLIRGHSRLTKAVAALVFTTAMSGALVAGLDAGLVYNEFPTMGEGRLAPPLDELMDDRFAQKQDGGDKVWRNLTQNPVTVQLIHRTLAITTACTVLALAWRTRKISKMYQTQVQQAFRSGSAEAAAVPRSVGATAATKASSSAGTAAGSATTATTVGGGETTLLPVLPPRILQLAYASCAVVAMQVTLGITTLIYMVPIPLASAHQAGSLALLSVLVGMISSMRPLSNRVLQQLRTQRGQLLTKVLKNKPPTTTNNVYKSLTHAA